MNKKIFIKYINNEDNQKKNKSKKKHTTRKSINKMSLFINTLTDTERKMLFLFMSFNLPKEKWYLPLVKTIPIKELQELDLSMEKM